jgi:hypothetical protein
MSLVMKNRQKKLLSFPKPPQEPAPSTIVVQIGDERFAIHWEIDELPLIEPLVLRKREFRKVTLKIIR